MIIWLLASLIFDSICQFENKLFTDEMSKITLVINTLNEDKNIAKCINCASSIADEIIVCDMYSDDDTVKIARSLGAKVIFHERTGFVEPARFFAISQATHEWVLVLDADEQMTSKLSNELVKLKDHSANEVVCFWSLYNYFGKYIRHGGFYLCLHRFFKKEVYLKLYNSDDERVHGNFNCLKSCKNSIKLPKGFHIIHEAYPTFEKYLRKTLCHYSLIESHGRANNKEYVTFFKVMVVPIKEFIRRYFIYKGFKDGKIGFILCYLKSQYTFYTLLNIWFLNHEKKNNQ
jgi:glycosyltransferase involved in cell wall biosynthesis